MAQSFIGSLISLVSTSDIRYRGILQQIDHANSTIQLEQVYSLGTEDRRSMNEFLPPNPKPYDYIVFRATEVKDLVVERRVEDLNAALLAGGVHNDPAVIGASTGGPTAVSTSQPTITQPQASQDQSPSGLAATHRATPAAAPEQTPPPLVDPSEPRPVAANQRTQSATGSVRSAEVAVESVERAMDALRVGASNGAAPSGGRRANGSGGRRGGGAAVKGPGIVPETPFDFSRANARFDKSTAVESPAAPSIGSETPPAATSKEFYDKSKSFFDDISSDSKLRTEDSGMGGGRGGRGMARQRREDERNRNLNTFGETGTSGGGIGGHGPRTGAGRGRGGGRRRGAPRTSLQT